MNSSGIYLYSFLFSCRRRCALALASLLAIREATQRESISAVVVLEILFYAASSEKKVLGFIT
ncbi:hypothetical protein [Anabaena catenula]|uniref:Uncharacterized protein n=1 Tax=Anabaena catenula FACHB-362 TaxID=2692877 RepID=A0ABR8IZZ2_9NOST|nr:hypothetical protein [Anabaena catenula]MBD2690890.1 hypothetical protein [Anabaena catenula FACHB-362]